MKKTSLALATLLILLLSSCVKDKNYKTYTLYRPHYSVRQEVKDATKLQQPKTLKDLGSFVLYNNTMYINEKNKGIHVIDYSAPNHPVNKGFIPIPGNLGLSIKNNFLYADCYCDLFVLKILSKENVELQNVMPNVFTTRYDYDTTAVELTWIKKDTTVTEEYYNQMHGGGITAQYDTKAMAYHNSPGTGGGTSLGSSMSVFTIVNDYLYAVDNSQLYTFSLADALKPSLKDQKQITWNIETIFPFKDKLFLGSMDGMFIYSIENPAAPSYLGQFNHVRVCDPVIADDKYAFVTLRGGSRCGGFTNQMDVLNIENVTNPQLLTSVPFINPHGLSKDGNVLFVCDGTAGVKVVDISDITNITVKSTITTNSKAVDVVAYRNIAFLMLDDAVQLYSYDQQFNVQLLSSLTKN